MIKTVENGLQLNEFAGVNSSANGEALILSNLYPSKFDAKACEGVVEMTNAFNNQFQKITDKHNILDSLIVQQDGFDKFLVVLMNDAHTFSFANQETYDIRVYDIQTGKEVFNDSITRDSSNSPPPTITEIDGYVYISYSKDSSTPIPIYLNLRKDNNTGQIQFRNIGNIYSASRHIAVQTIQKSPIVGGRTFISFRSGNKIFNTGTGMTGLKDHDIIDYLNKGHNTFQRENIYQEVTTKADDGTETTTSTSKVIDFAYNANRSFRVSYLFVPVRHIDRNNTDLWEDDKITPKFCGVFNIPENHGITNDYNVRDLTLENLKNAFVDGSGNFSYRAIQSIKFSSTKEFQIAFGSAMYVNPFVFPAFRISLGAGMWSGERQPNRNFTIASHIRVYRTIQIEDNDSALSLEAVKGAAYRFVCDLPILHETGKNYLEWQDGKNDLDSDDFFVSNATLSIGELNQYKLFNAVNTPNTALALNYQDRFFAVSKDRKSILMSMIPGADGNQGGSDYPFMYRTLFTPLTNFTKIGGEITALFGYMDRLFIFTKFKVYCIDNATNTHNGIFFTAPIVISNDIGTIFPKAVCSFEGMVYFINSIGEICYIRGSEVVRSQAKIKYFNGLAGTDTANYKAINSLKAVVFDDMMCFTYYRNQNYFNWVLYCFVNRPSENLNGWFRYERGLTREIIDNGSYGINRYGTGLFGGANPLVKDEDTTMGMSLCNGNKLYLVGITSRFRKEIAIRVSKLFERNLFEDLYFGEGE